MTSKARRITEEEAQVLRKVGEGDRIETRLYLLPAGKTRRRAPNRHQKSLNGHVLMELTSNEYVAKLQREGGNKMQLVYATTLAMLTRPGRPNTAKRSSIISLAMRENKLSHEVVSATVSKLIHAGHIRYVAGQIVANSRKPVST